MRALTTVGVVLAVMAVAGAMTLVALGRARERGARVHCRNNLRFLGQEAWQFRQERPEFRQEKLDQVARELGIASLPAPEGRGFWFQVLLYRFARVRTVRDESGQATRQISWNWEDVRMPIPFVCPFRADAARDWRTPESIDYRGPATYPESWDAQMPLAADRVDNHPDGTVTILRADLATEEMDRLHDSVRIELAEWADVREVVERGTKD